MPRSTFLEHPLHPQLVGIPIGLLPFSLAMDLMHYSTGDDSYADAAYYSLVGGVAGAVAAGAAGAVDYFDIPPDTDVKQTANMHVILNMTAMGVYGLSLFLRRGRTPPTGALPTILSAVGAGLIFVSSWFGGRMVYEQGMRVKDQDSADQTTEVKLPGDEKMAEPFRQLEKAAPRG